MSRTILQSISAALNWQIRVNENFTSVSPAGLYGVNPGVTSGLLLGYLGGEFNGVEVPDGAVLLTASTTNYVVAHRTTGVVTAATNTTNWNNTSTYLRLYQIATGASTMTTITDKRQSFGDSSLGSLSNPMTGVGDMIIGAASGAPARLPPGTAGQVLAMVSGSPAWAAAGAGTADMLSPLVAAEVSVTAAATATIDRMHVCSGTTADYTLTLPAASGNAGRFVGVRMAPGLTRWVTIDGNASELIDGALTRMMWATESAILFCDGAGWTKISGKSVPIRTNMRTNGVQTSLTAAAWNRIPMATVVDDNTSALAVPAGDTTNGRVRALRPGSYICYGFGTAENFAAGKTFACGVMNGTGSSYDPNGSPNMWNIIISQAAATLMHAGGGGTFNAAANTFFYVTAYNGDTVSRLTTASTSVIQPTLSVIEQPLW